MRGLGGGAWSEGKEMMEVSEGMPCRERVECKTLSGNSRTEKVQARLTMNSSHFWYLFQRKIEDAKKQRILFKSSTKSRNPHSNTDFRLSSDSAAAAASPPQDSALASLCFGSGVQGATPFARHDHASPIPSQPRT
jgi:hypothetical protein